MQPNFPPGKLPGMPQFTNVYFNMSQGEGDMRGPWNSDENFEYVSDRDKQNAVDGGDGHAQVRISEFEASVVEQAAMRTRSDPQSDPITGAMLGTGEATEAIDNATLESGSRGSGADR
jgi:Mn-containing catalase